MVTVLPPSTKDNIHIERSTKEIFENNELGLRVRVIQNEDGSISVNAADTARGFGWIKTEKKNGKEYTSIRWERMNEFSAECGFDHLWSKDDYIPEPLFYRLGMKANNAAADKFQNWLAMDVIPSIRKTGQYKLKEQPQSDFMLCLQGVKFIADDMRLAESSRLMMYNGAFTEFGLPTSFLPHYEDNGSRERRSATELLERNNCGMSTAKFNQLLISRGFLEIKERKSSKGVMKSYKSLTELGLEYGVNLVSDKNQKESQPYYYADSFMELFGKVAK